LQGSGDRRPAVHYRIVEWISAEIEPTNHVRQVRRASETTKLISLLEAYVALPMPADFVAREDGLI